jgi:hypothetical protein
MRHRHVLLGAACAVAAAGAAVAVLLVFSADSSAEPTQAQFFARVAAICRVYGPQLDEIRPPDVSGPGDVVEAVSLALPLLKAQERAVRALQAPAQLRTRLARWFDLLDRRIGLLEKALRAGRAQDFRTMGVAYIGFTLAGPETARLGRTIGIPHPPC